MRVVRFQVEGILNSFRIPFFRNYHKTFLAPPKSTIIGMLCNISLKSQKEFFEILEDDKIKVSVVIDDIEGRTKDLWSYKTLKKDKIRGKSVVRRDKLFLPKYTIYIHSADEELFIDILNSLKEPKNIPSLGLDDELITIDNVREIILEKERAKRVDSVFADIETKYRAFIKDNSKPVELPISNMVPTKFVAFDKKGKFISREVIEEIRQIEFVNCQIEFESDIDIFVDRENGYRLVFY